MLTNHKDEVTWPAMWRHWGQCLFCRCFSLYLSVFPQRKCFISKKSLHVSGRCRWPCKSPSVSSACLPLFSGARACGFTETFIFGSVFGESWSLCSSVVLIPFLFAICELSCFSYVGFFVILWTVDRQSPLSMGFFRQEYWRGLPCPSPGDLPDPGIKPTSPAFPALAGRFFTTSTINVIKFMIFLMFHKGLLVFLLPPSFPSFFFPSFPLSLPPPLPIEARIPLFMQIHPLCISGKL